MRAVSQFHNVVIFSFRDQILYQLAIFVMVKTHTCSERPEKMYGRVKYLHIEISYLLIHIRQQSVDE